MSGRDLTNGAGTEQVLGKMDSTRLEPLKNLVEVLFFFEPEKEAFSLPGKPLMVGIQWPEWLRSVIFVFLGVCSLIFPKPLAKSWSFSHLGRFHMVFPIQPVGSSKSMKCWQKLAVLPKNGYPLVHKNRGKFLPGCARSGNDIPIILTSRVSWLTYTLIQFLHWLGQYLSIYLST